MDTNWTILIPLHDGTCIVRRYAGDQYFMGSDSLDYFIGQEYCDDMAQARAIAREWEGLE